MASTTVGTSETTIVFSVGAKGIIQNLGSGNIYISRSSGVTSASGLEIQPDKAYEIPSSIGGTWYVISDTAGTDVRYEEVN